jgi:hypothetical protein
MLQLTVRMERYGTNRYKHGETGDLGLQWGLCTATGLDGYDKAQTTALKKWRLFFL